MRFKNGIKQVYQTAETGGEGSSGGGSQGNDQQSQLQAQIAAAVEKEVQGLKAKNTELILTNKKLAEAADVAKQFDGLDPVNIKKMLQTFESSEEAKLIAEGKLDDVLNLRFAKKDQETQKQLDAAKAEVEAARTYATRFNAKLMQGEVRATAPTDLHPSAMELAQLLAEKLFVLDEEGSVVPKSGEKGKDGKAPYSLKEWYEDLRGTHPTLFINGNSGSSSFNASGKGGAKTMSRTNYEKLSPAAQREAYKNGIQIVDR